MRGAFAAALALAALCESAWAQTARPSADVFIRSQAGLPASSARGEIEVVELGARALEPMVSIVGHRTASGWRVSYACAESPTCDAKHFVLAKEFDLAPDAARRVDAVLLRLEAEPETAGEESAPNPACGRLAVAINDRGVKRAWRRVCTADGDLAELETLLKAGLP